MHYIIRRLYILLTLEENCSSNKEWSECGSACPRTCANMNSDKIDCISDCVDGCHCAPGLWKDGDRCVKKEECSCNHAGIYYQHKTVRKTDCEEW